MGAFFTGYPPMKLFLSAERRQVPRVCDLFFSFSSGFTPGFFPLQCPLVGVVPACEDLFFASPGVANPL